MAILTIFFIIAVVFTIFIVKKIRNAIIKDVTKIATEVAKNIDNQEENK